MRAWLHDLSNILKGSPWLLCGELTTVTVVTIRASKDGASDQAGGGMGGRKLLASVHILEVEHKSVS